MFQLSTGLGPSTRETKAYLPSFGLNWALSLGQHGAVSGPGGSDGRWTPTDGYADIRCDEDYEAFYRAQLNAGRKLPPPLQLHERTLENYSELPLHLQQQQAQQQQQHQQQQMLAARMGTSAGMQHGGARMCPAAESVERICL